MSTAAKIAAKYGVPYRGFQPVNLTQQQIQQAQYHLVNPSAWQRVKKAAKSIVPQQKRNAFYSLVKRATGTQTPQQRQQRLAQQDVDTAQRMFEKGVTRASNAARQGFNRFMGTGGAKRRITKRSKSPKRTARKAPKALKRKVTKPKAPKRKVTKRK